MLKYDLFTESSEICKRGATILQLESTLQQHFGYSSFRSGQKEIIETLLGGGDALGVLPTGGGKSICYQLPALILPGLTVVVSPLISLMKDQVDTLTQLGIPAAYLNSSISKSEYQFIVDQLRQGVLKLLYVAPERLSNENFIHFLAQQSISLVAVDEAHCVSQWGFDFRPSYRNINQFIERLPKRPIVAGFTATATNLVQKDIVKQLELVQPSVFINSFDRPNIKFSVLEPSNRNTSLYQLLDKEEAIIIYVSTRKQVDKLHENLRQKGYAVSKYHAGLTNEERQQAHNSFINDTTKIIVATNAFGMGIDKTDVRKVIHYNLPKDLESYYQEAGRAGRDSLEAEAILLYDSQDIMTNKFLIGQSSDESAEERLETMIRYANFTGCIRNYILQYFGENATEPCGNCSNCLGELTLVDVTKEGQMVLSCIVRMKANFGMTMIVDVLRGSQNQRILDNQFEQLTTHGIMKEYTAQQVRDIISALVAHRYIGVNEYRGLYVTTLAKKLLVGDESLSIKERSYKQTARSSSARTVISHVNQDLYEALREVRMALSKAENVPAYIIFSNKTLEDMASKLPRNNDEFLVVEGIGSVKAEKYAGHFLPIIQQFPNAKKGQVRDVEIINQNSPSYLSPRSKESYLESVEYAEQGLSPYEIAIERGISETTVLSHLTQAAEEGALEEFDADVPVKHKRMIKDAIQNLGTEKLKPLKEAVPDKITYDEIKYVLIEFLVHGK